LAAGDKLLNIEESKVLPLVDKVKWHVLGLLAEDLL